MHCILHKLHFSLHGHPFLFTAHGILSRSTNLFLCLKILASVNLSLFLCYLYLYQLALDKYCTYGREGSKNFGTPTRETTELNGYMYWVVMHSTCTCMCLECYVTCSCIILRASSVCKRAWIALRTSSSVRLNLSSNSNCLCSASSRACFSRSNLSLSACKEGRMIEKGEIEGKRGD